ncbi:metabotropic glutamate receptor isoform X1 [Microplitis mediator]|uniref:metabotropic glutamate receptor isoform X1 n=1 Tax=Microplitis mediator TaxID=375433 RepID=UPI0025552AD0|nr:metabotropic glutamate receptor isoform X1 [Microplitis mediator]
MTKWLLIVILHLMVLLESGQVGWSRQPTEREAILIPGDIVLGGLFPVHEKGDFTCGPKIYNRGVQRLEAMLFAVDQINKDDKILPGISLGVHILDTCSRDTYALNQSLHFVRASLSNLDISVLECADGTPPRMKKAAAAGRIFGVIGGSYSSVSLQVANLLRLFHIPQISPASTAKALSDKTRFDYFARTVPPDTFQSIALVDVVKSANWSYVSTVHSEGSYGESGIEVFTRQATERNVCIAAAEKVPSAADDKDFDSIIQRLSKKPNARAVVLFTRAEDARRILEAARRSNITQPFQWIASDGWGRQNKLVEGIEDEAEGAITVELQSKTIPSFDDYMQALTPQINKRNPWFGEYWEDVFDCTLPKNPPVIIKKYNNNNSSSSNNYNSKNLNICSSKLRLSPSKGYEQESKVQFVVDAVYAFALALNNLQKDLCKGKGLCQAMIDYDKGIFYKNYLLNVSFTDSAGSEVKFDEHGDGLARYEILNFRKNDPNISNGYNYQVVGKWYNGLSINIEEFVWAKGDKSIPTSVCSLPCESGMIRKQQGDTCCWVCDRCEEYEYVYDDTTCKECSPGYWPHPDKRGCYALPVKYIRWDSAFAIAPAVISCLGIIVTLAVAGLMFHHRSTPVVRASGRELTIILLAGVLVCYLNTFVLLAQPTFATCVLQRFGVGVSFSAVYGALLTKTNRIARIFDSASRSAVRPKYISPRSQVCIASFLIGLQVMLTLIWMIVEPAGTRHFYPDRRQVILKCNIQDMSFLFSQLYNALLIVIATVYAVKTRKIPENFNESKFIGFTMYTTCIIWLAFVPIYFGTGNAHEIQITTLCVAISLSASVTLVCLYSPKVYIIVFQPDKNIRGKVTMGSSTFKKQGSSAGTSSVAKYTGCEMSSEHVPLRSALCAVVQTSVGVTGVTEISQSSNASEQVAQL